MLYFRYKKFIDIFKIVKRTNNTEHIQWKLEEKYGNNAKDAISILKAKGVLTHVGLFQESIDSSKMDSLILEYEEKRSSMFWSFTKWVLGTTLTILGLLIAFFSAHLDERFAFIFGN